MSAVSIPFRERISCTIHKAMAATGLSRSKLYQEVSAGRLEITKIGGRTFVRVDSLTKLVAPRPCGSGQ
jgi:hypothetical protein